MAKKLKSLETGISPNVLEFLEYCGFGRKEARAMVSDTLKNVGIKLERNTLEKIQRETRKRKNSTEV